MKAVIGLGIICLLCLGVTLDQPEITDFTKIMISISFAGVIALLIMTIYLQKKKEWKTEDV